MLPRTTFSVVVFCKKTKVTKKGKAPIYARITTADQSTEVYTQCQIEPERHSGCSAQVSLIGGIDESVRGNAPCAPAFCRREFQNVLRRIIWKSHLILAGALSRIIRATRIPICRKSVEMVVSPLRMISLIGDSL